MAHKDITIEELERVAQLARLDLDADRLKALGSDLNDILAHVDALAGLDTDDVEPMARPHEAVNRLDADDPEEALPRDLLLEMAPEVTDPYISVPKVLEEGGA